MVALGLARVAEDERGAERGAGFGVPDVRHAAQEALAVAPAAHVGQQRAGHVLERQVEVRHTRPEDGLDQLVGQAGRIQIEQPRAHHLGGHGAGEGGDGRGAAGDAGTPIGPAAVAPVGGQVLGHQDDLAEGRPAGAGGGRGAREGVHLGQNVGRGAGALLAPERRNGAEAADAVAAFGHLHVGPRGPGRGTRQLQEVERVDGLVAGRRTDPRRRGGERHRYGRRRRRGGSGCQGLSEAGHEVHLGQRVEQLVAVAFGQAPGHHQAGAGAALVGQLQYGVDRLLAGRLYEGARVHHDQVGVRRVVGAVEALRGQVTLELVRVHLVLRATQRLQPVEAHDFQHTPRTNPLPAGAAGTADPPGRGRICGRRAVPDLPSGEGGI